MQLNWKVTIYFLKYSKAAWRQCLISSLHSCLIQEPVRHRWPAQHVMSMWVLLIWTNCLNLRKGNCDKVTSPSPVWVSTILEMTACVDRYFCAPGRMTCWTWRPCFRKIPGWGARSFSLENSRALRSPYLKSPGTFMWMDTFPNLTEKNRRKMSCHLQKLERAWREAQLMQQRWVGLFQCLQPDICR